MTDGVDLGVGAVGLNVSFVRVGKFLVRADLIESVTYVESRLGSSADAYAYLTVRTTSGGQYTEDRLTEAEFLERLEGAVGAPELHF